MFLISTFKGFNLNFPRASPPFYMGLPPPPPPRHGAVTGIRTNCTCVVIDTFKIRLNFSWCVTIASLQHSQTSLLSSSVHDRRQRYPRKLKDGSVFIRDAVGIMARWTEHFTDQPSTHQSIHPPTQSTHPPTHPTFSIPTSTSWCRYMMVVEPPDTEGTEPSVRIRAREVPI